MSMRNKIKGTDQQLDSHSNSFQLFLHTIRENRPAHPDINPSEPPLSEHQPQLQSKQFYSEGAKSLYFSSSAQKVPQKCLGDPVLRNHHRVGHANRYAAKQHQLPSHFFTPTKNKLQQYLQNSRVSSNSPVSPSSPIDRHPLFRQGELASVNESKALKGHKNHAKLQDLSQDLALKYCMVNRLTPSSDIEDVLLFFVRLLELLNYSIPQPKIEKYRDCVYFGPGKSNQEEGLLYSFDNSLYFGELCNHNMNGTGVQIFFSPPAIFRGEFKDGKMLGFFEVKTEGERYSGGIKDRLYHGHGRLINDNGFVEGQFAKGKLVYTSYSTNNQGKAKRQFIKQTSMMELPKKKLSHQIRQGQESRVQEDIRKVPSSTQYEWSRGSRVRPIRQQSRNYNYEEEQGQGHWSSSQPQKMSNHFVHKIDVTNLMEFSYPFGNQIAQPVTVSKAYRSRVRGHPQRLSQKRSKYQQYPDKSYHDDQRRNHDNYNPEENYHENRYEVKQEAYPRQEGPRRSKGHNRYPEYERPQERYPKHQSSSDKYASSRKRQNHLQQAEWSTNFPQRPSHLPKEEIFAPIVRRKQIGQLSKRFDSACGQEHPLRAKC